MIKNNKIKILLALVSVAIISFVVLNLNNNESQEVMAEEEKSYSVEVLKTEFSNEEGFLEYSAVIKNRDMEEVLFPTVANIKTIHVKQGDSVYKGQLLVTLEDDNATRQEETAYQAMVSAEASMNSAKSNLDLAQMQYDKELEDQKNDTDYTNLKNNYEASTTRLNNAQSEVDEVNTQTAPLYEELETLNSELSELNNQKSEKEILKDEKETELSDVEAELLLNPTDADLLLKETNLTEEIRVLSEEIALLEIDITNKEAQISQKETDITTLETSLNKQTKDTELALAQTENQTNRVAFEAKEAEMEIQLATTKNARDTASYTYDGAKASYESSKSNYESAQDAVEDLNYYAKTSGLILSILQSEGEVATPLVPIMIVGTDDLVAEFGVSSQDVAKVKAGNYAVVTRQGESYSAEVLSVDVVPDETSRTYLTDVILNNKPEDFLIGELVSVKVYTGNETGVFLPINVILNDGQDYVYVVENDRATRKNIEIISISDNNVMVLGLNIEDLVISKGMKNIKSGYLVSIVE